MRHLQRMSRVGCRGIDSNARFTLQPVLEMPGLKARSGEGCDLVATQKTRSAYLVETRRGVNVDWLCSPRLRRSPQLTWRDTMQP